MMPRRRAESCCSTRSPVSWPWRSLMRLEVVDVEEDDGDALAQAAGALHLAREELVEGAAVEAAGQALAPGEAALALAHPREDGREDARGHGERRHQHAQVELHLPQPRRPAAAPLAGARGGVEVERLLQHVDADEDQHRDQAEGDGGEERRARVGHLVAGRGRELAVDPGPRARPGEVEQRGDHERAPAGCRRSPSRARRAGRPWCRGRARCSRAASASEAVIGRDEADEEEAARSRASGAGSGLMLSVTIEPQKISTSSAPASAKSSAVQGLRPPTRAPARLAAYAGTRPQVGPSQTAARRLRTNGG